MRPGLHPARYLRRPVVWAALSYLLVATLVLWPSIRPGRTLVPSDALIIATPYSALPTAHEPHNLQLSDATFQFFPWFHYVAEGMRDGEIRQWNPFLLGGVPVSPNGNVSPYYPLSWLGGAMSPFDAYDLFVVLHLVIGALGVYVLGRALGIRPLPAWVGGLLAFTAAFWVNWSTHLVHVAGMVWAPWVLAATWWLLTAPSRRRVAALAAVVGLWLLGGSPQYVYYGALALIGWAGIVLAGHRIRGTRPLLTPAVAFALAMVLGVLLAAPVLLPTLATSGRVVRTRESEAQTGHVPLDDAIRLVVPGATGNGADRIFYGSSDELRMDSPFLGVTALLLAGAAFGGVSRVGRRRLLLVAGTITVIVLAFTGIPHRLLYEMVPGYDRFRSSPRWLFLLPAFALPLAALGLQDLLSGARRAQVALLASAVAAGMAVVAWYAYEHTQPGAPLTYFRNRAVFALALLGVIVVAGRLARSRPRIAVAALVLVALGEILFHTQRWYPRIDQSTAYPDTVVSDLAAVRGGRFITVGVRHPFPPFAPDVSMVYGVADAHGLSVLFPKDYDRFLRLIDDYGLYAEEFNLAPSLATGEMLDSRLLDVLDVRTVLAERDVPIPGHYRVLVPPAVEPWVYERPTSGGAMVVADATPATDDEMWAQVGAPGWDPRATAAVLGLDRPLSGGGGTATERPAPSDRELWEVDAPGGGFLRVGARWDPGWSATVDGKATPVLRADGVFRGVVVPAGRHVVRFSFRNPEEMRGRLVAGGALVVLAGLLGPWPRNYRRRQPNCPPGRLDGKGGYGDHARRRLANADPPLCGHGSSSTGPRLDKRRRMRKRNLFTALAAAALILQVVGSAGPAVAQVTPDVTYTFTPGSGPAGTKIAITGAGCPHDSTKTLDGMVFLTTEGSSTPVAGTLKEFRSVASGAGAGTFTAEIDTTGVAPGAYTPYVLCTNTSKVGPGSLYTVTVPVIPGSTYFPLTPGRVLDTRDGTGTTGTAPLGAGATIDVVVTNKLGVPATGVTAVALNVVATNATGPASFLTVWPTGQPRPNASNLNFQQGVSVPNLVIARVGVDGKVSLYNNLGTVHVAADVQGYFLGDTTGSTYVPLSPGRLLDTRSGTGGTSTPVGPGNTIEVKVTDGLGVPATGVTAVAINVTATNVSGAESFLTVWPAGSSRPVASNLNFIQGQTVPNLVIARVGLDGKIAIYNNVGTVDVVGDIQGYFAAPVTPIPTSPTRSVYFPATPARILDTRDGTGVPGNLTGQLGAGATLELQVTGAAGVPVGATAVVLNVTVTDSFGPDSFLTVYPSGTSRPFASNLNWVAGQTVPNLVIARIGAGGKVTIYNNLGQTFVVADVQGWFMPAA